MVMIRLPTCPICNQQLPVAGTESPVFPFCSARCKQIDLWRWCNGRYAIIDALTPEKLTENLLELDSDAED
jgi:endogenous inhibitor of DNA gyrase (YacG/DUF329 family)